LPYFPAFQHASEASANDESPTYSELAINLGKMYLLEKHENNKISYNNLPFMCNMVNSVFIHHSSIK